MTTVEIINTIEALKKTDPKISLKIAIACAMNDNLDLHAYDPEGINEIGNRILLCLSANSDWPNLDELCDNIQTLIDSNEYKTISGKCIAKAFEYAKD